jgi:hypothetical protein
MRRVISAKVGLLAAIALLLLSVLAGAVPLAHSASAPSAARQTTVHSAAAPVWHTITFTEVGLPANQVWSVFVKEVGESLANNTPATIVFNVNATNNGTKVNTSGNYTFSINSVPGYDVLTIASVPGTCGATTATQYCNVTAASATVTVTFHAAPQYNVVFNETGLTGGTWSVTFGGTSTLSGAAGANITFGSANGTYPFTIGGGNQGTTFGTNTATPSSGTVTVAGDTIQNITFTANPPGVTVTVTFPVGAFSTNHLPYFALPYNVSWNVSVVNATLTKGNVTQTMEFIWLQSGCGPFTFPCPVIWTTPVSFGTEQPGATATSGEFVFPVQYANLTASTYLGFNLPEGQWQITITTVVTNAATGAVGTGSTVQAAFIALNPPAGTFTAPTPNLDITAGTVVTVTGSYSGYFVVSANVTITSSTGALVLTASVFGPGVTANPFTVSWHAQTVGEYSIVLDLVAAWHLSTFVSETVNVTAGTPVTYINGTGVNIGGIGAGGSAAILVTIGVIVGMIVMALVGRNMMGGSKPAPAAQPWSPTTGGTGGTGGTSGGTGGTSGGSSGGMSDSSSGSGMGGQNPPS